MFHQVPQRVPRVSRWRFVRLAAAVVMMAIVGLGPNLAVVDASTTAGGWLTFQNNSGRDVSLVIKYDHPGECGDGYWWVTGWWIIAPGDSARVARLWQGHNPNFYYYGYYLRDDGSRAEYSGSSGGAYVTDRAFDRCKPGGDLGGDSQPSEEYYWVDMHKISIDSSQINYTHSLNP